MSKYDPNKEPSSLAELEPLILAAQAELSALCNGKKFRMSIPVQDDDSDMVIGDALRHSLAFVKAALPVREAPQEAQQACCAPTPDRTGRTCDKPKGHSGPHWTYGGGTMTWDEVCEHGTALDVHCCNCHSGFIFDKDHECPSLDLGLYRCKFCGTRWLLWPDAIHGGGWNLLDKWQRPCACCDNVAMGEQVEHLRDIPVSGSPTTGSEQSDYVKALLTELLTGLGLTVESTIASVQRRLHVGVADAMRLLALHKTLLPDSTTGSEPE